MTAEQKLVQALDSLDCEIEHLEVILDNMRDIRVDLAAQHKALCSVTVEP